MTTRARSSDIDTAQEAGRAADKTKTEKQAMVLDVFRSVGHGMTDHELAKLCEERYGWGHHLSTARTRRSELTEMGKIYDTGERVKVGSHRLSAVWALVK